MFRLEKLEISGFESFADRTSLVFGEGITGVVGPNGCGKSNIAEAISWVLGEQSAKNLRGGKMEDVIFNGTRDRKPTGMAEVLLTLVAIEDIAARDNEASEGGDQQEYEDALTSAENAADAARALVEELAPPAEQAAIEPGNPVAESQTDNINNDASFEEGARLETAPVEQSEGDGESVAAESAHLGSEPDLSAAVTSDTPSAMLELTSVSSGDDPKPGDKIPSAKKKTRHLRKRKAIAISAGERVTVGRRLYRTGDSDYLMNGRTCLLRDIQDLFAGTGLGGSHYAIIEQGRIGQILSSKPLDRRGLIEEAAGITKFKSRKRAAELKLESAKQNLTRLNDIISEVERQVNSLKRQAAKARRYKRLHDEMRSLQSLIFIADFYRLRDEAEGIAAELETAEKEQARIDALLGEREAEYRTAAGEARLAEDSLTLLRERAAAL